MTANEKDGVCFPQPHTTAGRIAVASAFVNRFRYPLPLLVDPIDNPADRLYAGWPERFYILDRTGNIVYKGKLGPFGFAPDEVDAWLRAHPPG